MKAGANNEKRIKACVLLGLLFVVSIFSYRAFLPITEIKYTGGDGLGFAGGSGFTITVKAPNILILGDGHCTKFKGTVYRLISLENAEQIFSLADALLKQPEFEGIHGFEVDAGYEGDLEITHGSKTRLIKFTQNGGLAEPALFLALHGLAEKTGLLFTPDEIKEKCPPLFN